MQALCMGGVDQLRRFVILNNSGKFPCIYFEQIHIDAKTQIEKKKEKPPEIIDNIEHFVE
jgi:hypothetical protein